ncbi:MAG: hypothetical protein EPO28_06620 [Saprospiraceae bacterium]|nr:MAG: hypothetical protein EPO28_06620 [Saprospiraceae bacterium]
MKNLPTLLFLLCCCSFLAAQPVPFPAPGHEGLNVKKIAALQLDDASQLQFGLWTQNRVMYDLSNIPGPGGTSFSNTGTYDFFRQRFRAAVDVRYVDTTQAIQAGAYTQLEYRGGWGGSSPAVSDPRGSLPVINPYNRLQPRGVRYGFVYLDYKDKATFSAGILPLTDGMGRVLFDADWDFNVGGIAMSGPFFKTGKYRVAYVRLIDGIGAISPKDVGLNSNLYLFDQSYPLSENLNLGAHIYSLDVPADLGITAVQRQLWLGVSFGAHLHSFKIDGLLILNNGKIGAETHTGQAFKLGISALAGKGSFELLGLLATGDDEGQTNTRFVTLHQIVGTAGYWGMTHIYTPNGPSDVNDFGLEIGNNGAGLATVQGKYNFAIIPGKVNAYAYAGRFRAMKNRNGSKEMGAEFGGMLTTSLAKYLQLETGAAYATAGKYFAEDADGIFEIFSRFQFTW